jgi:hypothetical protein
MRTFLVNPVVVLSLAKLRAQNLTAERSRKRRTRDNHFLNLTMAMRQSKRRSKSLPRMPLPLLRW